MGVWARPDVCLLPLARKPQNVTFSALQYASCTLSKMFTLEGTRYCNLFVSLFNDFTGSVFSYTFVKTASIAVAPFAVYDTCTYTFEWLRLISGQQKYLRMWYCRTVRCLNWLFSECWICAMISQSSLRYVLATCPTDLVKGGGRRACLMWERDRERKRLHREAITVNQPDLEYYDADTRSVMSFSSK